MTSEPSLSARIEALPPLDELRAMWVALETEARPPFFLTWHWVGAWLAEIESRPDMAVIRRGSGVIGLALIGRASRRIGPLNIRQALLNQAGSAAADCVYIEYNDVLAAPHERDMVREALIGALADSRRNAPWRDFRWAASAVAPDAMPGHRELVCRTTRTSTSPYVDLDRVREKGGDYVSLLSANSRHQIRRAMRLFEAMGQLRAERAATADEGLEWLGRLEHFHQARWTAAGKPGAFSRPVFKRFARRLVEHGHADGLVDVVRASAGSHELGYLFNFVCRGEVSNYQSGFQPAPDGRYKPGLVAHALAVRHYARKDTSLGRYNFLSGASRYKDSLATGRDILRWYVYRPTFVPALLQRAIGALTDCRTR